MRIAYLGPPDTFTHMAALSRFGQRADYLPSQSLDEVFRHVETGACDYGVVPVENSIEGAVTHTLDLFRQTPVVICGEILLPVHHYLVAQRKSSRITTIFSHPQAFGQCRQWLERHLPEAFRWETSSTTEAVTCLTRRTVDVPTTQRAAITTGAAVKRHHLHVIAASIEDHRHNTTRFLVIGRDPQRASGRRQKTSVLFALKDRPGALHDALVPFKRQRINLTKIESRPSKQKAWAYYFFIDLEGHESEPRVARAVKGLSRHANFLKVLGSYPVEQGKR